MKPLYGCVESLIKACEELAYQKGCSSIGLGVGLYTEKHAQDQTTEKVQALWKRIFPEWFPTSGYEHADAPEFEMYYRAGDDKYIAEVWIPVVKNNLKGMDK
ncbi:MAG: GyrI-like domain-containing protein [Clostridiaceae bacterium]